MKIFLTAFIAVLFISLAVDAFADPSLVDGRTGKYQGAV